MGLQKTGAPIGIGVTPAHKLHMVSRGAAQKDIYIDHSLDNGTGLASTYRPVDVDLFHHATDLAAGDLVWSGIRSGVNFGHGAVAARGTVHSFTADMIISGAGHVDNEYAPLYAGMRFDIGTGFTQTAVPTGRGWLMDLNVHGPIAAKPDLLNGITLFYNNYYNGSPNDSPAGGIWLVTRKGSGGGKTATHEAANTYAIDVGLGIVGDSDVGGTPGIGWTKAIQIGGFGSGWKESGTSRIGTGIEINDYFSNGIKLTRHASGTGPAIAVAASSGPVVVGATSAFHASALLEVVAPATSDPLVYFGSTSGSFFQTVRHRNGVGSSSWFVSGGVNNGLTGTVAGDSGIVATTAGKTFHLGGTTKVVSVTQDNKLGFFAVTPIAQAVLATGAGATVDNVITALQNLGLVKQS